MKYIIILAASIVITSAQFPHPGYLDIPGVTPPPWQGPLADHINGIPPRDTPEVSAAKAALNRAYAEVLAVLPELPPEERYRTNPQVPVPPQHFGQHIVHHNIVPQHDYASLHHVNPTPASVVPTIKTFAEDVPRSPLGEVPEVYAARVAHLKAHQDAAAALPRLADTHQRPVQHYQHPGFAF